MANYNVTITDGKGSAAMKPATYSVTANADGYESTTLSPTAFTATAEGADGAFTMSANGVLTIIFNETGAQGGAPITGGSVVMTDSTGAARYGSEITIGTNGEAVFNNVPYSAASPYALYFVQLTSDDAHEPFAGVITVNMNAAAQTEYVANAAYTLQTVTLTDANYSGLPVANATLDFQENETN